MKTLFVYGDSWPFGVGLNDPYKESFPSLLQELLQIKVKNFSQPATSIDHAVYTFLNHCKTNQFNKNDLVLFCLTGRSRALYFDENGSPKEIHPRGITEEEKNYFKYIHSTNYEIYNFEKNVLLCKLLSDNLSLKSYFISNWEIVPADLYGDINFYNQSLAQILHPERSTELNFYGSGELFNTSEFMDSSNHPTALGHQKIAKVLAEWIN